MTSVVSITATTEQAEVIEIACDLYARLGIGQFRILTEMVQDGQILPEQFQGQELRFANLPEVTLFDEAVRMLSNALGFTPNGNRGIHHHANPIAVRRAYEVSKVVARALALHRDTNPDARTVKHDGLPVRLTSDPAPRAEVVATDLYDRRPNLGYSTAEPSLRELVRKYYAAHFDAEKTEECTRSYFEKLDGATPSETPSAS
jgi:hypothetical protein